MLELLNSSMKRATLTGIGPGSKVLRVGDFTDGYYGELAASEFFTGAQLAAAVGLSTGTLLNSDTSWFKVSLDGKTYYVPRLPIRNNVSWNTLDSLDLVKAANGGTISKNGFIYQVRLMTALGPGETFKVGHDPISGVGSEYNRIVYRLCNLTVPNKKPPVFGSFDINYLGLAISPGCCYMCQEQADVTMFVQRNGGEGDSTNGGWTAAANILSRIADTYRGWRPIVELVGIV